MISQISDYRGKGFASIIYRYIGKEFIFSFFVCFLFFFFIFFVNQILFLAEKILEKKVPIKDVIMLLVYFMPSMISLSFPFAALVSCLMTVGRLCTDNEILAMQALGIRHIRIFAPLIVLGVFFSFASFYINDYLMPYGTIKYTRLYKELIYSNPALELQPYSVKEYLDTFIITGEIEDTVIHDIVIFDKDNDGNKRVIKADRARFLTGNDGSGVISLELSDVFSHANDQKKEHDYNYFTSEKMIYNILLSNISSSVRTLGPREMSAADVRSEIIRMEGELAKDREKKRLSAGRNLKDSMYNYFLASSFSEKNRRGQVSLIGRGLEDYRKVAGSSDDDRNLKIYKLEFYKKFSLPFACLCFVLFAFPAGLFSKRSGRTVGFGIGLLFSVFYWCMIFAGHTLGVRSSVNPFLSMWMPDIVILLIALVLYLVRFVRR